MLDKVGVEGLLQEWDHFVADAVALDRGVVVRDVLAPVLSVLPEIVLELRITAAEERTDEFDSADFAFLAHAAERRPAEFHEERLRDVVHMMACRNRVETQRLHALREERETDASRRHLKRLSLALHDLRVSALEGNPEALREGADEPVLLL